MEHKSGRQGLTGRIQEAPSSLIIDEILQPQFHYEMQYYLPYYIKIEKVLTSEYERMGLITLEAKQEIVTLLEQIDIQTLSANAQGNMSDILFAIERYVEDRMKHKAQAWHTDRSRNDVQATAQVMFAREQLLELIGEWLELSTTVHDLSEPMAAVPMPGYTHYQAAQMMTVGFYLTAINEQIGKSITRLQRLVDDMNECPLGSGAMAGAELTWDRERMSTQLGFACPTRHALVGVASKEWMMMIAGELSTTSTTLSRFLTDLITWGSSEYQLIDLPDSLSGISSAMPQKKNYPILERIRGKTAHITAYYMDFITTQRNTPFTNLVETAKEGGSNFYPMMKTMKSIVKLFRMVVQHVTFNTERMTDTCKDEFFGGFSLANLLTMEYTIPYRQAQVFAGKYIVQMIQQGNPPLAVDVEQLKQICEKEGFEVLMDADRLRHVFEIEQNLFNKNTLGSTHPEEVKKLLAIQKNEQEEQQKLYQKMVLNLEIPLNCS